MFDIDIVIPFVDCDDPSWSEEYNKYFTIPYNPVRFRSWGTVKYVLRGIELYMPWVHNVFLIVMSPTQVPVYIDQNKVKIIYHSDYMPGIFTPCFNSNPIEMFVWAIPDLMEHFILFNDDIIPIKPLVPDDFFKSESVIRCCHEIKSVNSYPKPLSVFQNIKLNSTDIAYKACELRNNHNIILSQRHGPQGYLKSKCKECFIKVSDDICDHLSRLRSSNNINHYLYTNYMLLKGQTDLGEKKLSLRYLSFDKYSISQIEKACVNSTENILCINDTSAVSQSNFLVYKSRICETLDNLFHAKCELLSR